MLQLPSQSRLSWCKYRPLQLKDPLTLPCSHHNACFHDASIGYLNWKNTLLLSSSNHSAGFVDAHLDHWIWKDTLTLASLQCSQVLTQPDLEHVLLINFNCGTCFHDTPISHGLGCPCHQLQLWYMLSWCSHMSQKLFALATTALIVAHVFRMRP